MSMSSSNKKKKVLENTVAVDIGCSCGRPKLSKLFFPKLKPKVSLIPKPNPYPSSRDTLSPSTATTFDTTPFHSESEDTAKSSKSVSSGSVNSRIGESIAVEKDSNDPYLDFRHSMLNMILEKEIYSKEELKELLECFLSLNSPYHHEIIVRAFTEIWDGVFSTGQGFSAVSSRVRRRSREFQFSHV